MACVSPDHGSQSPRASPSPSAVRRTVPASMYSPYSYVSDRLQAGAHFRLSAQQSTPPLAACRCVGVAGTKATAAREACRGAHHEGRDEDKLEDEGERERTGGPLHLP